MSDTTITITVDQKVFKALKLLADIDDWTVEDCARRYLSEAVVEGAGNFEKFIEEGERDIREGRFFTQEEMQVWFEREKAELQAEIEARKARPKAA